VTIPRFSLSHDTFQPADSAKYLVFSTREFEAGAGSARDRSPSTSRSRTSAGNRRDFRRGIAAFHAFDFDESKRVFAVCGTSTRVLALHEQLGAWGAGEPVLPRSRVAVRGLRRRLHPASRVRDHARPEQIDRGLARRRPHGVRGPTAPSSPNASRIGFGIWTMLPIRDGRSRSLDGQGMNARWRRFRVRGVDG
jgi:hypothetical protein